jgi:hypothetical protein
MPRAAGRLLPERVRPSSVPIGSGAVGAAMPVWARRPPSDGLPPSAIPTEREVVKALEASGEPEPDDEFRSLSNGGGSAGATPAQSPTATAMGLSASLTVIPDAYTDSATQSVKNNTFRVTWSGGAKEDYSIVQWVKGYMKKANGKPFKTTQYGKKTDIDFADFRIDSDDEDPVYRNKPGIRWNYYPEGPEVFSSLDSPGPMYTDDGAGAEAKIDFLTGVYKTADVPTKTTGTISALPLSPLQAWSYHVLVQGGGKFKH